MAEIHAGPRAGLDPRLANEIVARILTVARPEAILLFGSRARGDAEPRSDIDLAVAASALTRTEWLRVVDALEETETLLPIQAVLLGAAPPALRERILREGVVLYAEHQARR